MTDLTIFLDGRRAIEVPAIALSIRQPWAWLIAWGFKGIENRTWATRFRGLFLVHASLTVDLAGYEWVRATFPEISLPHRNGFDVGGYVGLATLADMFAPEAKAPEHPDRWRDYRQWGHFLERATALPKFVPGPGRLQYFTVDDPTRRAIAKATRGE